MDAYTVARFWSKVTVKSEKECWPWTAGKNQHGYGEFKLDRSALAHRIALEIFTGQSLEGVVVRHTCDNRECCNPFHLRTGTHADNVMDRVARDRSAIGEQNGRHVLTAPDVLAIRASGESNGALAKRYGVDRSTISAVVSGRSWKHLL